MYLGKLSPDLLGVLISTLTRFFSFALDFHPESQNINNTTYTSSYIYWFLVLSADILSKCSLSKEMQARHTLLLAMITPRLHEDKPCDYLVFTASIYASIISKPSAMCSSPSLGDFLRAVARHRDRFKDDQQSQLRKAVKANEVAWGSIDSALKALGPSGATFVPNFAGANDTIAGCRPLSSAYDRDPTLGEGGRSRDPGESPSRECRLSYLDGLCLTRLCSQTRWWYIIPGRG